MTRYRLTRRAQKEVDPMLGRTRDEVREGARSFRQGAHMIFYRIERDGIVIVGLPHASVDFDRYFD